MGGTKAPQLLTRPALAFPRAAAPHLLPPPGRASGISCTERPGEAEAMSAVDQRRSRSVRRGVILPEENGLPEHMGLNCRETGP